MDAVSRRRIVVRGRVQGVFFRDSVREQARHLRLTGWVRNRPDGTVEIEAQGEPATLDRLADWCRVGPPRARVLAVDVDELDRVDGEHSFDVTW